MKVRAHVQRMLWRGAEWLAVTLAISWFLLWECTRGGRDRVTTRRERQDKPLGV
jgi:hypothetical protein